MSLPALPRESAVRPGLWPTLTQKEDSRELTGGAVFGVRLSTLKAGMGGVVGVKHFNAHYDVTRTAAAPGVFSGVDYTRYVYTLRVSPELSRILAAIAGARVAPRIR